VVRLLLANGADVNARGGHYGTALQAAAAGGQLEAVKLLLQHGADPLAAGGKFGSALEAALGGEQPHHHVANYLRRHLAKVEAQEAPAEGVRT
jgi:ankyrin repeat protein